MLVTPAKLDEAMTRVLEARRLTIDLETDGLRPYQGNRLIGEAIEADGWVGYFPRRHRVGQNLPAGVFAALDRRLLRKNELLGFNSIRFDGPMYAQEGEHLAQAFLEPGGVPQADVIIDALLANENEPSFSLDALGRKYLGDQAAKAEEKQKLLAALKRRHPRLRAERQLMGKMADLTPEETAAYACGDVLDTKALRAKYAENLELWGLTSLAKEMYDFTRLLAKIERRGLLVDQDLCVRRERQCLDEAQALRDEIRAVTGPDFNPGSPAQVADLLGTADSEAGTILATGHELALKIVGMRRRIKMAGTYYRGILELLDPEGVVHPQMNVSRDPRDRGGTRSSRLSCSNPNFQNLPKRADEEFMRVRDVVIARPGHRLLSFDYEGMERWLAYDYCRDQALLDAYTSGRDLYQEMADSVGTDRAAGKAAYLAIQYGAGPGKLADMFGWPHRGLDELACKFGRPVEEWRDKEWRAYKDQRAVRLRDSLFEMCPGLKDCLRSLRADAEETGAIRLWTGRAIHFDGRFTRPFTAWNRLIQGGGAEMVRVAMQRLERPLDQLGAAMVLQVHDEIVVESPEESVDEVVGVTKRIMESFNFALRPRVEVSVGERFGRMQPWEGK